MDIEFKIRTTATIHPIVWLKKTNMVNLCTFFLHP